MGRLVCKKRSHAFVCKNRAPESGGRGIAFHICTDHLLFFILFFFLRLWYNCLISPSISFLHSPCAPPVPFLSAWRNVGPDDIFNLRPKCANSKKIPKPWQNQKFKFSCPNISLKIIYFFQPGPWELTGEATVVANNSVMAAENRRLKRKFN